MVIGLIKGIHIRKDVLNEKGLVDIARFLPVARLGDISYGRVTEAYRITRPTWAESGEKVRSLDAKENGKA